jgi:hypothetical protein
MASFNMIKHDQHDRGLQADVRGGFYEFDQQNPNHYILG